MRSIQAIAVAFALLWFVAAAAATTAPPVSDGAHVLVAVEPLLQSLQLPYIIEGSRLQVDGRAYPNPLVDREGKSCADATHLARFLHLDVVDRNGLLVFTSSAEPLADASPAPPPQGQLDVLKSTLIAALNDHRKDVGLGALDDDPVADVAAQYQAQGMAERGEMGHEDAIGRTPMQRYTAFGGRATWYGENVGWYGFDVTGGAAVWDAVSKLDGEMMAEQPPNDGHRQNILDPHYQAVGIGVSVGPKGLFLAEDFVGR